MIKNEIRIMGDYAEIVVFNRKREEIYVAQIDLDDVQRVTRYNWCYNKKEGYLQSTASYNHTGCRYLHQLVAGKQEGMVIDHIDERKHNNRKSNLRHTTSSRNKLNVSKNKGVCFDKSRNKWMAYIQVDGKGYHLGRFEKEEDAVEARRSAKERFAHV